MKKFLCVLISAVFMTALSGCDEKLPSPANDDNQNVLKITSDPRDLESTPQGSVINRNENKTVSAPEGSIGFEKACDILDKCDMNDLQIPQSAKYFQKYYFGTVEYYNKMYYSIYLYSEKDDKKVFIGNNILVSCDGELVLTKSWLGYYDKVSQNNNENDKDFKELFPDAKQAPSEALKALADKNLQLEYTLSQYVFEFSYETINVQSIECYIVTPKIEFTDSINLVQRLYISTDGTNRVFKNNPDEKGEYIELA